MPRGSMKHYKPNMLGYAFFPWPTLFRLFRPERVVAFSVLLVLIGLGVFFLNGRKLGLKEPEAYFMLSIAGFFLSYAAFAPFINHSIRDRWTFKTVSFDFAIPPLCQVGSIGLMVALFGLTRAVLILARSDLNLFPPLSLYIGIALLVFIYAGSLGFTIKRRMAKEHFSSSRRNEVEEEMYEEPPAAEYEEPAEEQEYAEEDVDAVEQDSYEEEYADYEEEDPELNPQ